MPQAPAGTAMPVIQPAQAGAAPTGRMNRSVRKAAKKSRIRTETPARPERMKSPEAHPKTLRRRPLKRQRSRTCSARLRPEATAMRNIPIRS